MERLNIRFVFFCRAASVNASGLSPLVLRVIYRGQRKDLFTGLYCHHTEWNAETQTLYTQSPAGSTVNKNLDVILRKAFNSPEGIRVL